MTANGTNPFAVDERVEWRIRNHLRRSRGRSVVYLARRYGRALSEYLEGLGESDGDGSEAPPEAAYHDLDDRTIVALKLCAIYAAELVRFASSRSGEPEEASPRMVVGGAVMAVLGALGDIEDGREPPEVRSRRHWPEEVKAPAYLIVHNALAEISEHGRLDPPTEKGDACQTKPL